MLTMNAIGEHQDRHGNDHHGHGHSGHVHHAQAHQGDDATGSGPTGSLWRQAVSATLHCLLGCAIGEVLGMVIGTALGLHNLGTVVLSIALAFVFVFWMTNLGGGGKRYFIVFDGSVAGLTTGSSVGFNGIKVGEVQSMQLDPNDARKVQVLISVHGDTPVRENSRASRHRKTC